MRVPNSINVKHRTGHHGVDELFDRTVFPDWSQKLSPPDRRTLLTIQWAEFFGSVDTENSVGPLISFLMTQVTLLNGRFGHRRLVAANPCVLSAFG